MIWFICGLKVKKRDAKSENGYGLSNMPDQIRPTYHFNKMSQDIMPQAIFHGGDSDTIAAIAGSMAEKEFYSCTLDDENAWLRGHDIAKYSYRNVEKLVPLFPQKTPCINGLIVL